jgi:hypothetical protein
MSSSSSFPEMTSPEMKAGHNIDTSSSSIDVSCPSPTPYPDHLCFNTEMVHSVSRIQYKAQFAPAFGEAWRRAEKPHQNRKYLYVLDNGIEANNPSLFPWICAGISLGFSSCLPICANSGPAAVALTSTVAIGLAGLFGGLRYGLCNCIGDNPCCPLEDNISKMFFDKGLYFGQDYLFCVPLFGGKGECMTSTRAGHRRAYRVNDDFMCCCCLEWNKWGMVDWLCGDMVAINPVQEICGCPARNNCCLTTLICCPFCCGLLCAPRRESPLICLPLAIGLEAGEAENLASAINDSYAQWTDRTKMLESKEGMLDDIMPASSEGNTMKKMQTPLL